MNSSFTEAVTIWLRDRGLARPEPKEWVELARYDDAFSAFTGGDEHRVKEAGEWIIARRRPSRVRRSGADLDDAKTALLSARGDATSAWAHRFATESAPVISWRLRVLCGDLVDPIHVDEWVTTRLPKSTPDGPLVVLRWGAFDDDRWTEKPSIEVAERSDLGGLAIAARGLSERFTWTEAEAAVFVLTGLEMFCFPIRARGVRRWASQLDVSHDTFTRATITIDPSVSPAELARWWAKARLTLTDGEPRRLQVERQAKLAGFMAKRWATESSWADDHRTWNRTHPQWEYSSLGGFRTEALRAMSGLGISVPR